MSNQMITFATFGKLKGKTVNLGPDGKYRFVNGEMRVPEADASKVAVALRWLSAGPKSDIGELHKLSCQRLGIDPDTLEPLRSKSNKVSQKKEPEYSEEDAKERILEVVFGMDVTDDEQWTQAGIPSIGWVKDQVPSDAEEFVTRDFLNSLEVTRESLSERSEDND